MLLGTLVGVAIGPRVQIWYWSMILDHHPNYNSRLYASMHLGNGWQAYEEVLWERVDSSDPIVRNLVVCILTSGDPAQDILSLWSKIPDSYLSEKLIVLDSLDYAEWHALVIGSLIRESKYNENSEIRENATEVLKNFREADAKIQAFKEKIENSNKSK